MSKMKSVLKKKNSGITNSQLKFWKNIFWLLRISKAVFLTIQLRNSSAFNSVFNEKFKICFSNLPDWVFSNVFITAEALFGLDLKKKEMTPVFWNTNAGLILTVKLGSALWKTKTDLILTVKLGSTLFISYPSKGLLQNTKIDKDL